LTKVNFITEDRMLRNTDIYENRMFTNKVKPASFGVGEEKEAALIKRAKLTLEFEETFGVAFY